MAKIRIRTGRGTGTMEVDDDPKKWSGDEFRKIQEARKKAAGNRMIHTGRGTGSKKLKDVPEPKARRSTEGMTRITGRGTGSRKSKNKGS
ncbi:MAG: hypothetical protein EA447_00585 [Nitrosopumilus sp.]|nr:MAG: hypothetical protein EA447_00585 [Nitrosopumilus sp.]